MTKNIKDWALDSLDSLTTDYTDTRDRLDEAKRDYDRGAITATDYEEISLEFVDARRALRSAARAAGRTDILIDTH